MDRLADLCTALQIEALDPEADDYVVIDRVSLEQAWPIDAPPPPPTDESTEVDADTSPTDTLLPPLHHLLAAATSVADGSNEGLSLLPGFNKDEITVVAHLDKVNPLTEARWVKTGEVEQWIISLGLQNGQDPKKDQLSEWRGKIVVADPDPVSVGDCFSVELNADLPSPLQPPTIQHALDSWTTTSNVASIDERRKFVATHMADIDNGTSLPASACSAPADPFLHHSPRDPSPPHSQRRNDLHHLPFHDSSPRRRRPRRHSLCSLPRFPDSRLARRTGHVPPLGPNRRAGRAGHERGAPAGQRDCPCRALYAAVQGAGWHVQGVEGGQEVSEGWRRTTTSKGDG